MLLDKILLSTTLGDAIVNSSSEVYVKIHSDQSIRKEAKDVEEGETVLWYKNKTGTKFKDVEPFLVNSPRYKHSLKFIMEENEQGKYINKLRTLIIRGLAENGIVGTATLEDRILNNHDKKGQPMDFDKYMVDAMSDYLVEFMMDEKSPISIMQAKNWISGETVAPLNWDHFRKLEKLNPEFRGWEKHKQERDSIYFNYRLYVVVRQQIERKLWKYLGGTIEGDVEKAETFITVNPEYQLIINHFLDEHTNILRDPDNLSELVFARVNKKSKIRKRSQERHVRKINERLTDGLFVKRQAQLDAKAMSYQEVAEHRHVINHIFGTIAEESLMDISKKFNRSKGKKILSKSKRLSFGLMKPYLTNRLKSEYFPNSPNRPFYDFHTKLYFNAIGFPSSDIDKEEEISRICEVFKNTLFESDEDSQVKVSPATSMRLLEVLFKLDLGIPSEVKKHILELGRYSKEFGKFSRDHTNAEEVRRKIDRYWKGRKRIESKFNIEYDYLGYDVKSKIFFSDIILGRVGIIKNNSLTKKIGSGDLTMNQYLDKIGSNKRAMRNFYRSETVYGPDVQIFSRKEVLGILEKYQFSDLIGLIEGDFHYEKFLENGNSLRSMWGEFNQMSSIKRQDEFLKKQ